MKTFGIVLVTFLIAFTFSATLKAKDWANLGKYQQENSKLSPPSENENRVVFMGNSIIEKWGVYDSTFFTSNPYICRGISGQVTSQMLIRFRPDVIDLQPKVVVILAETNDIAQNQGPISIEQIAGNIFSMAELAKANGIKVVLCKVLPANSYKWRPDIQPSDQIIELNALIEKYARKNKMVLVDFYSPMVDSEKGLKKEYGRDSVHPGLAGYKVMEQLVKEGIAKAISKK